MTRKGSQEPTIGGCISSAICVGFPDPPVLTTGLVRIMDGSMAKRCQLWNRRNFDAQGWSTGFGSRKALIRKNIWLCSNGYRKMEQISKASLPKLTRECFSSCGTVSELIKNRSTGSLIKALGLDSRRFQRLRLHNGGCDLLRWLQYEKGTGREIPDNVLLWMYQQDIKPRDVQFIADRMSMVQVYNYVRRQMPSFRRNSHEVLRTWEDYLSMAKKLHMDVYDEIVYRTRKLRRRHDDLVLKCQEKDIELQAEEMEEKFPHVNAICQEIKTKYEYADADYMVVVPSGILDIITEGRALHHCVGSSDRYWDRIERRESFVMFLRKTDDPFHAYYTLEVEPDGTVRQKRTEYDRQKKDIEQATEFLQKWQRVVTARLTESDKALAAESRVLREKEFIQLKKDRVIIHTGIWQENFWWMC